METKSFSSRLIRWFHEYKRDLPWRHSKVAYTIWLSEIILQQTRVKQGLPYFLTFSNTFPTVHSLAKAPIDKVLRLWQGLGYYSRARNLHMCAKIIVSKYNGEFPRTYDELRGLPGIGKYTAAAIVSLAYDLPVPVVDGNVYRVLSRVFGVDIDITKSKAYDKFFSLALSLIDHKKPGEFNQALMEFGAIHCIQQNPSCQNCPFAQICFANKTNQQGFLPVKTKKAKPKSRYFNYFIIQLDNSIALKKRTPGDIWEGLYEYYLIETRESVLLDALEDELLEGLKEWRVQIQQDGKELKHVLTHQHLFTKFYHVDIPNSSQSYNLLTANGLTLYKFEEAEKLPKPVLVSNYLNRHLISVDLQ